MAYDPNDPDTKAAIDALKADAADKMEAEVSGLKTKVSELLTSNKQLKKGQEIDPAEVERLESERDDLRAKLTAAEKQVKESAKVAETATKALETESGFTRKLLVENGLKDTLIKGGVKDEDFLDALVTKFSMGAAIVADGDVRKAMQGDKELSVVVTEYLASDSGKKFVAAPLNGGGGATGGAQCGGADLSKLSPVERITAARAAAA